jgi:DNA-binding MarR family transcriptional regulator
MYETIRCTSKNGEFHRHRLSTDCLSVRLRLINRVVGTIYDEALRPHAIKASQLNILVAVSAFGRVTSRQLCRVLHMDTSTFSRALARLKKSRWLQVEPSGDGKILKIEITKAGFKKIEQAYPDWLLLAAISICWEV